jgi:hypothetical protein
LNGLRVCLLSISFLLTMHTSLLESSWLPLSLRRNRSIAKPRELTCIFCRSFELELKWHLACWQRSGGFYEMDSINTMQQISWSLEHAPNFTIFAFATKLRGQGVGWLVRLTWILWERIPLLLCPSSHWYKTKQIEKWATWKLSMRMEVTRMERLPTILQTTRWETAIGGMYQNPLQRGMLVDFDYPGFSPSHRVPRFG